MIINILLLFVFGAFVYNYYVKYGRKSGQLINHLPGPSGLPILGNTFLLLVPIWKLWKLLRTLSDQYYPIFKVWLFLLPIVSIRHPDDLEKILNNTKHIEKGDIYDIFHPWFRTGLLTSKGAKWHARRKMLTPTFHFNILQQFVLVLIEESEKVTKSLKDMNQTVIKDVIPFISEHTLNAICETAMGTSLRDLGKFQYEYRQAVNRMGQLFIYRFSRPWLHSNWIFALHPKSREQKKVLKILHGFTERIITERKLYHERTNGEYLKIFENDKTSGEKDVEIIGVPKKRLAMLDLLIAVSRENYLTDLDIREEVDTFMFEGHDTTAVSLCFSLSLLAEHKDIQDRVRAEINAVMKENGEKLTMKSLQDLHYLERCIKESLRLYPSVWGISRITAEDVKLCSYTVPSGTILHLNIHAVNRDPNFWPNPEVFDPDRFLPENIQNRHPYSYIPFSAGPRNCIGQRFAMLEMKAILAPLVQNFYLEPVDYLKDLQVTLELVFRSLNPMRIKFIPVKQV